MNPARSWISSALLLLMLKPSELQKVIHVLTYTRHCTCAQHHLLRSLHFLIYVMMMQTLFSVLYSLSDLALDLSALALSGSVGSAARELGEDDARQPSVDGLHSPRSPSAPTVVAKTGGHVFVDCVCPLRLQEQCWLIKCLCAPQDFDIHVDWHMYMYMYCIGALKWSIHVGGDSTCTINIHVVLLLQLWFVSVSCLPSCDCWVGMDGAGKIVALHWIRCLHDPCTLPCLNNGRQDE